MLSQIIAVTSVNLRSLGSGPGSSAVAVIGIAGVVVVFVGVLSIAEGFRSGDDVGRRPGHRHRDARRHRHAR